MDRQRFPTGKILVHLAKHGAPLKGANNKFWAKSYGDSQMQEGDIVRITIQHQTSTSPRNRILDTVAEEWRVTEVSKTDGYFNEVMTYFERM